DARARPSGGGGRGRTAAGAGDGHAPCVRRGRGGLSVAEITYLQAIRDGIREEMERDPSVLVLGEDVGAKGGVFGVTEGLQKQFGEWRVLDSPLAEALIAGVAIGAVVPSTPYDAKGMIVAAVRDPDPVMYFEHKRAYRAIKGEVPEGEYVVALDRARIAREGSDIAIFTYGMMVHSALEATERLVPDGFECEVV